MSSTEAKRVLAICGDRYHPAEMVMGGLRASVGAEFAFELASDGALTEFGGDYVAVVIAKINVSSSRVPEAAQKLFEMDHLWIGLRGLEVTIACRESACAAYPLMSVTA